MCHHGKVVPTTAGNRVWKKESLACDRRATVTRMPTPRVPAQGDMDAKPELDEKLQRPASSTARSGKLLYMPNRSPDDRLPRITPHFRYVDAVGMNHQRHGFAESGSVLVAVLSETEPRAGYWAGINRVYQCSSSQVMSIRASCQPWGSLAGSLVCLMTRNIVWRDGRLLARMTACGDGQ